MSSQRPSNSLPMHCPSPRFRKKYPVGLIKVSRFALRRFQTPPRTCIFENVKEQNYIWHYLIQYIILVKLTNTQYQRNSDEAAQIWRGLLCMNSCGSPLILAYSIIHFNSQKLEVRKTSWTRLQIQRRLNRKFILRGWFPLFIKVLTQALTGNGKVFSVRPVKEVEYARFGLFNSIFGKWYASYFYLCEKYACPGPCAISPFFESKFARMKYAGSNRFHLSYMRHTGQWFEVYQNLSSDECLKHIRAEPSFHP